MTDDTARPRLGFFTRVLDDAGPAERYANALEQIETAERLGFDTAWVAQHHFHADEGGLPSPFVLLGHAAARTSRIGLGTAIITLPLEAPIRVAEDAAVLDLLAGGRFELGVGSGGTPSSFPPFGHDPDERPAIYRRHLDTLVTALRGATLTSDGGALYPEAPHLAETLWEATFSAAGAERIGAAGHGLMLSRTQPRGDLGTSLAGVQRAIVDAYRAALPDGVRPRVLASRTLFVADDAATARRYAERGVERAVPVARAYGIDVPDAPIDELLELLDIHIGTPDVVIERLRRDDVLLAATDIVFQVHPVDPPHELLLRSLEHIAERVAPALGWRPAHSETRPTQGGS